MACRCLPASRCHLAAIQPVSVAVSRTGLVYVANSGTGGSGYTGFRLNPVGKLTPVPHSTVTVPDGSGLGDVFFNSTGDRLVGTRTGTSQIDSFVVLPNGRLLAAPGSPFTGQGLGQLGIRVLSRQPLAAVRQQRAQRRRPGHVSAYRDGFLGQLTSIGSSPYADGQTAPCWVEISHNGRYLFTVNTGSGNISSYSINPDGSLALIGSFTINGGGADIDARLSPDGKYLSGRRSWPQFRVRVRRQRRQPHRAGQLPDPAARRGQLIRDREHLGTASRLLASVPGPSAGRARERTCASRLGELIPLLEMPAAS